ncbi:hypothetical protein [Christiangramia sp.]|uniref:hypothetical protein n=1 Tax=Christiangramia sp. TaxID=1931228 RepID=UPI0026235B0E|nr:hypothetical protein [Christiangramia sp.]
MQDHIKFKMLTSGYPGFDFPEDLLEEVDLSTFYEIEEDRFPLFVGTQFGTYPLDFPLDTFEGKKIAILHKSLLSGHQSGLSIYEIRKGKRNEIQKITLKGPIWEPEKLKEYHNEPLDEPKIKIPEFYAYEIWFYFELIGSKYRGFSLPEAYHQAISTAYRDFVNFGHENTDSDWISFLRFEQAGDHQHLFRLLDKCIEDLYPDSKTLPLPLERELQLFRNIRNPYQRRCKSYAELPAEEDVLILSELGLCVYYNNFININSHEARETQNEIIQEFRHRNFYIKNENLFRNQANPIQCNVNGSIPVLQVNNAVDYRKEKDIPSFENGVVNAQLLYEGYYAVYNELTDIQVVDVLNKEIGIKCSGIGRAAHLRAIKAQFKSREIDTSAISDNRSFTLAYCVVLKNKKLVRLGELGLDPMMLILRSYFKKCYPSHDLNNTRIIYHDLEKLELVSFDNSSIYVIPINDLLKQKGEMKIIGDAREQ